MLPALWLLLAVALLPRITTAATLVPAGSLWRYLDTGADLGTAWRLPAFDDSAWPSGSAPLGYGDGDENTVVGYGTNANARFITTYFRSAFVADDASAFTNLFVRLQRDDGGIVYLNGVEVFRSNMPTNAVIAFTNLAASTIPNADEVTYFLSAVSPALLISGTNLLAAEIHQAAAGSSDISFDLMLYGNTSNSPPVVRVATPTNNAVLRSFTNVTFTATAADPDGAVANVEFFVDATSLGTDTNTPFSISWSNAAPGSYALTAVVTDALGEAATSAVVRVTVLPNQPPSVTITNPPNASLFPGYTNVLLGANAADPDNAIVRVEFYTNGVKMAEDLTRPYQLTWSNAPSGEYALAAVATDNGGISVTSAVVNITLLPNVGGTVTLTNPADGALFPAITNLLLAVSVADSDGSMTNVDFLADDLLLARDRTAPFAFTWTNPPPGLHSITAVATDNGGLSVTSAVARITVNPNVTPIVSLSAPTNGAVFPGFTNIVFSATAADGDGFITNVEFFANDTRVAVDRAAPFSQTWTSAPPGSYALMAVVADNGGLIVTSALASIIVLPNVRPTCVLTNPADGVTLYGLTNVTMNAVATDADGSITNVEFFSDDTLLGNDRTAPFAFTWTNAPLGQHILLAIAFDNGGFRVTSAPVNVTLIAPALPAFRVVPTNAVWRYLETNAAPEPTWREADFDDSAWPVGRAQLGYGDGDETTVLRFGPDPNNKYITSYFRYAFELAELSAYTNLILRVLRDDGVVVHLNGIEVWRNNLPASAITHGTLALTNVSGAEETNLFLRANVSAALLQPAANILAVEIHQAAVNSTDISFALEAFLEHRAGAPACFLGDPQAGDRFSLNLTSNLLLRADAYLPGMVDRIDFFSGMDRIAQATNVAGSAVWSNPPPGIHILSAVATGTAGVMVTSPPVAVWIYANFPPSVSLTSPSNSTTLVSAGSSIALSATASDSDGAVSRVEFYANATRVGEALAPAFNAIWSNLPTGQYALSAVAIDDSGEATVSVPVFLTVITNAVPRVAITNPPDGAELHAGANLILTAAASDTNGAVVRVEFYAGNAKLGESLGPVFSTSWSNVPLGAHTLTALAFDNSGAWRVSPPVNIFVNPTMPLLATGSVWRILDTGINPGSAWTAPGFDDSAWRAGPGPFGYGDGDEATLISFGPDPTNRFITTYFRRAIEATNLAAFSNFTIRLQRDDGAVVYLNGLEIFRSNMPTGAISHATLAATGLSVQADESAYLPFALNRSLLLEGTNTFAVEVHQASTNTPDMSFDLELSGAYAPVLVRGPYLQLVTPTSAVLRWRTDEPSDSVVRYGAAPDRLDFQLVGPAPGREHEVAISNLPPNSIWFYSVGSSALTYAAGGDCYFTTAPPSGQAQPTRIWVLGDSGTGDANARNVRNAFATYTAGRTPDVWLMVGDNAYDHGSEDEYHKSLFGVFPSFLRQTALWPALGNHDTDNLAAPPGGFPYERLFSVPTNGAAGGEPSGTKRYWSFDWGNIHFVALDSMTSSRATNGAMLRWLARVLAANTNRWLIAYWHHPPYTKNPNDADAAGQLMEMRANAIPMLEAYGVDLVLCGHQHDYERTFFMDGHYGLSTTFTASMKKSTGNGPYVKTNGTAGHQGTVYVICGASAKLDTVAALHPATFLQKSALGSLVIDVNGDQMDVKFLRDTGVIDDQFTMMKPSGGVTNLVAGAAPRLASLLRFDASGTALSVSGPAGSNLVVEASRDLQQWSPVATNFLGVPLFQFVDPAAGVFTQRFYRAVVRP